MINLVPRPHSVTGNVRSGKVRRYTIFHWLLKKVVAMQSTLRLAYFAGHLVKVWFSLACSRLSDSRENEKNCV